MVAQQEETSGFLVQQAAFQGSLSELSYALRSGSVQAEHIDVLVLVRAYLQYFQALSADNLNLATEALPKVAQVIELKLRLLLPKPPKEQLEDEEEDLETTLEAIALLEELEDAIDFLRQRRMDRRIVITAKAPKPDYPRARRPNKVPVDRLTQMASRYRSSHYFELAIERLSMAGAMKKLMKQLKKLRKGWLTDLLEVRSWEHLTVTFAGMLELLKEGKLSVSQEAPYAPIHVALNEAEDIRNVA